MNYLEIPDAGSIVVDGEPYFDASEGKRLRDSEIRKRRLHFGLVFQSFNLFPQYTVMQNLVLAARLLKRAELKKQYKNKEITKEQYASLKAKINPETEEKAKELLAKVGLSEKAECYPCQ